MNPLNIVMSSFTHCEAAVCSQAAASVLALCELHSLRWRRRHTLLLHNCHRALLGRRPLLIMRQ